MKTASNKPPLGTGARFKNLVGQLSKRPSVTDPKALAGVIGARKYGVKRMGSMSAASSRKRG